RNYQEELFTLKEDIDLETAQTNTTAKLPILKQGEYEMWKLRIEQYFQVQDYALWDVIENGNSFNPVAQTTTNAEGCSTTLILGPYKDAKTLFAAIQARFGGNEATKKTHKTLLKQMNKPDLDTMSFDDLYNNFKIVEQEVKGTTSSNLSLSSQNMDFVSSPSSTNEVNTAYEVNTANTQVSPASTQVSTASTQLALLSMRTRRFFQKTGRKITINRSDIAGYDKSKVKCFNCHKLGHFTRECRGSRYQDSRNRNQDSSRRTINVEETSSKAMLAIDGDGFDWSIMEDDEVPTNMALMDFSDSEFNKSEFDLATYKRGLASAEEQLVFYKKNEELVTNDKIEKKTVFPTVDKIEFVRPKQQEKPVRKPVKYAEMSFDHVHANCNYHQRERVVFRNNYTRVNYNYSAKKAYPSAHRNMVPRRVLMKSGLRSLNTARPVNTTHPKTTVYSARPMSRSSTRKKEQGGYCLQCMRPRHMTGNMPYLSNFKEFDGGYVTFRGGAKGGRIIGKGTLKTSKLDFEDMYFVKELQFNIFSVSQMCDKKNPFTDYWKVFVLSLALR
ncbi:ribonuclease H-like domain-containing protein, partial [Tanacetum coccineum]